jgi:dipeptidyl aminopeptidase/acylaminoacyl peptidase
MAFKDWGFFPYVAEQIAKAGFVSCVFNFSLNGVAGNGNRITEFERFSQNTFSQELRDLETVVSALEEAQAARGNADSSRIGLLGHSRGGGIAIVHASSDRRIKGLVSWSAISSFDRWTRHQKDVWRANGFLPLAKNSTVSPLRLGLGLLEDIEHNRKRLDIVSAASNIVCPWMILHGHEDVTVPVREAEQLFEAANPQVAEKEILEHVGHLYNAASQNEDNYFTLKKILALTTDWFREKLS